MKLRQVKTILYSQRETCDLPVSAIVDLFSCYSEREQISVKLSKIYCRNLLNVECCVRRRPALRVWAVGMRTYKAVFYFCSYNAK